MSNVDINVEGRTDGRTDGRKIGRLYRTLLQAGAIKIWNLNVNCIKVTGAWNIGQGHQVNVPDESEGQRDVLYKVLWLL